MDLRLIVNDDAAADGMPPKKRQRTKEVPIWAQKWPGSSKRQPATSNGAPKPRAQQSGVDTKPNEVRKQELPLPAEPGNRRVFEPSFTNVEPWEEFTKTIADFIFQEAIHPGYLDLKKLGPNASIEIEAKIGQLLDRNTNERVHLPVLTECILDDRSPKMHTTFRSSMTMAQHSKMNNILNDAVAASHQGKDTSTSKARTPISYVHTREKDSFYQLSQAAVDATSGSEQVRAAFSRQRLKPRLRITHDKATGKELARIIKIRLRDLDVYSPQTVFDWRISINIEVNFTGDIADLEPDMEGGRVKPAREKDRLTYRQQGIQIDLTQVTMDKEKEHELEFELSPDALRKEAEALQSGVADNYLPLIRTFVDNVRTAIRGLK